MGVTIEQHRSAIGRFKPSGIQRVSAKTRREIILGEVVAILTVAKIRRKSKQVDTKFALKYSRKCFNFRFGKASSFSLHSVFS